MQCLVAQSHSALSSTNELVLYRETESCNFRNADGSRYEHFLGKNVNDGSPGTHSLQINGVVKAVRRGMERQAVTLCAAVALRAAMPICLSSINVNF